MLNLRLPSAFYGRRTAQRTATFTLAFGLAFTAWPGLRDKPEGGFEPVLGSLSARAEDAVGLSYQQAPAPLDRLLDAPFLPGMSVAPNRAVYALLEQQTLPDLAELAEPELKLAGLRFNPRNTAPSRTWSYVGIKLLRPGKQDVTVTGLPAKARISNVTWSPDSRWLAFTVTETDAVRLWMLDAGTGQARRLSELRLNRAYGTPFVWAPDSRSLIFKHFTAALPLPANDALPEGPVVMENMGQSSPGRTYQDLLKNPADSARFKHYVHGRLMRVGLDGTQTPLGEAGLIIGFDPSPDGKYLLVRQLREPFSYAFPAVRFPTGVELWDAQGKQLLSVAELPLADQIPIHFDAVRPGRRSIDWRADAPASLYWLEALDGGDPRVKVDKRDRLWLWQAPFANAPIARADFPDRIEDIYWGRNDLALLYTDWYEQRRASAWLLQPDTKDAPRKLQDFSSEDRYQHPGMPLTERNPAGLSVLRINGDSVYLNGDGATPDGERPFLDRWDLRSGKKERMWQSQAPFYEKGVDLVAPGQLLTRRESKTEPPNYYLRDLSSGQLTALTNLPDPMPEMRQVNKQIIDYTRADGVKLNGTLYLPPGYKQGDGPLPLVMWAYPREFKSSQAAGQVKGSPYSFVRLSPWTPLVFLTQGYAVLDDPAMPIVGEGGIEPNDSFREQLVASAAAAVDKVVSMGVADRNRIAIGGHSYGAFMAVNLLAHSDLFAAGIARSGAYNRTLTPFGFQSEQRTLWQAPEIYLKMSPLLNADKLKEPLLLIHGEADDNSGTYPMQSQNLYSALKGLGAPVRLVMLPYESHSYRAKESIGHMLWEMVSWLDQHVKKKAVGNRE